MINTRQVITKKFPFHRNVANWLWPILTITGLPAEITYQDEMIHIQCVVPSEKYDESVEKLDKVLFHVQEILALTSWPKTW